MFHLIKHKGIKQKGFNWASLHIQLEKDQELIVVTSYTKHGWEIDTISTLGEVQDFLGKFTVPWVWGGDFNRPTEELLSRGINIPAQAPTPKGEWTTCSVGGKIDYFLTPTGEQCPVEECNKIKQTVIRPHDPVQIKVNKRPHVSQVLGLVAARKWPEADPT